MKQPLITLLCILGCSRQDERTKCPIWNCKHVPKVHNGRSLNTVFDFFFFFFFLIRPTKKKKKEKEIQLTTDIGKNELLQHTGMCCPNRSLFHQKSLDMGPILVKKILRGSHFTKIAKNIVKSAVFEAEKPLEMGLDFQNLKKKLSYQPFFEWKKSLDMGRGVGPRVSHSVKK